MNTSANDHVALERLPSNPIVVVWAAVLAEIKTQYRLDGKEEVDARMTAQVKRHHFNLIIESITSRNPVSAKNLKETIILEEPEIGVRRVQQGHIVREVEVPIERTRHLLIS